MMFSQLHLQVLLHLGKSPVYLLVFWAVAFFTLALSLVACSLFSSIIESDFELGTLRKELILAVIASAIQGGFAWLIAVYVPAGARGMLIPLIIVALLYQVAHYDTWSRYDAILLIGFQLAIFMAGMSLVLGHFVLASVIVGILVVFLSIFAAIARSL